MESLTTQQQLTHIHFIKICAPLEVFQKTSDDDSFLLETVLGSSSEQAIEGTKAQKLQDLHLRCAFFAINEASLQNDFDKDFVIFSFFTYCIKKHLQ